MLMNKDPLLNMMNNSLINLPTPSSISNWWNYGSLLGLALITQTVTGLFLSMHYCPNTELAFDSMIHIIRDTNNGWFIRTIHANGASLFFICLYIHMARGLYYGSYTFKKTWTMGTMILLMTMATAFLGYVLPWGQMSFWGATVITNLVSAVPYLGNSIVQWLWGGFAINNATLNRFFTLHFILPFIIMAMTMVHLIFLHQTGSNNPLGLNSNIDKIVFHPYFNFKDTVMFNFTMLLLMMMVLIKPYMLSDPDNFMLANPLVTPTHIKPEWYFLFAYAILRSIPNKLGGVIALAMSIMIFMIMPLYKKNMQSNQFYPINKTLFWMFLLIASLLTWIGARPVEDPFITMGQILTISYFSFFPIYWMIFKSWDNLVFK